ncbi:chloride transporter [Riemerella anatipestifer]|uniref:chorismate-binding protein n=1 Tax=Riemerella anatipestifer TaxID=34085 RepID=UPI000D69D7CF|nr:chorismate-binding protein [Riemerella anatipestifer]MDR7693926.1 chorismate-binding protein [Riemerella anatipestifer]MDR7793920.1 chorismate-binding protein [Riemerella anatipestifer]MDY3351321.1 chorismate-binding protein [Riemerella anatipestifer]MRM84826.1 chloride transporter [Riemerella anatipestifer]MRM93577.1 chloride transporter [Riemerella anatipestifer]
MQRDSVFYRLPNITTIYTLSEASAGAEDEVSFFDFDGHQQYVFKGTIKEISAEELQSLDYSSTELKALSDLAEADEDENTYLEKIAQVVAFIKTHRLPKLVISRRKILDFNGREASLTATFLALCKAYPSALVYLLVRDGKCWVGATPETLGEYHFSSHQFKTMSLAGTLSLNEEWTDKELEEQKPVTDYIKATLIKYSDRVEVSETYTVPSGSIKHLRNDFVLEVPADQVPYIIEELHPTPAVCGIPKAFCKESIKAFESHSRELYSGYIKITHHNGVFYFVNLRCAEVYQNKALVYVGGGINAKSLPPKEWRETELKALVIKNHLVLK